MDKRKVGCIGTGVMGSALMEAVAKVAGESQVVVYDHDTLKAETFCRNTGCVLALSNRDVASGADFVFLAVKPKFLAGVLEEITPALAPSTVLVSMAAGIKREFIKKNTAGHSLVIRIMPNTPAAVGAGMIAISPEPAVSSGDVQELERLLSAAGLTEQTAENLMDAVTAVSGSGPAYGYLFIEALADAAVKMGMSRQQALRYSAQTLKGAAEMVMQTGTHPAALKDGVCSPAGLPLRR
jgi:pyrroline-5-carboxylate reductase